jgi:hypothetical protein
MTELDIAGAAATDYADVSPQIQTPRHDCWPCSIGCDSLCYYICLCWYHRLGSS